MNNNNQTEQANHSLTEESASVQSHLQIMQGVIQRMASNSTSCKAWCITIVSAILVLIADKNKPELALLAMVPTALFMALDAYYLALEKGFRESYNEFIKKIHSNQLTSEDLFAILPKGKMVKHRIKAFMSFSVWWFYLALIAVILVAKEIVLK